MLITLQILYPEDKKLTKKNRSENGVKDLNSFKRKKLPDHNLTLISKYTIINIKVDTCDPEIRNQKRILVTIPQYLGGTVYPVKKT